jgi:pimeloyl-ACP methyl ester carboxylesterase
MLSRLEAQAKACPTQKFALGGHSQGSGVAAATIPKIPKDILARVVAVTMIGGRPCESLGLGARCQSYCHFNDVRSLVCSYESFADRKVVCWPDLHRAQGPQGTERPFRPEGDYPWLGGGYLPA